jgi:hypothetical protein
MRKCGFRIFWALIWLLKSARWGRFLLKRGFNLATTFALKLWTPCFYGGLDFDLNSKLYFIKSTSRGSYPMGRARGSRRGT